jgi:hypothetical protein
MKTGDPRNDRKLTQGTRRKNSAAGIWEIRDAYTEEKISRFRARRHSDVTRYLEMARIGLNRPIEDFEAVYITDWDGPTA